MNETGGIEPADDLPAEVAAWLGQVVVVVDEGSLAIERGVIENFCVAVEDANPLYWDEGQATTIADGLVAPPALLSSWTRSHRWTPAGAPPLRPLELHFLLKEKLGLPRAVVIGSETCYHAPARIGDRVRAEQVLDAVGAWRDSRLGRGRRWAISVHYRNQYGALLGSEQLRFFAYLATDDLATDDGAGHE